METAMSTEKQDRTFELPTQSDRISAAAAMAEFILDHLSLRESQGTDIFDALLTILGIPIDHGKHPVDRPGAGYCRDLIDQTVDWYMQGVVTAEGLAMAILNEAVRLRDEADMRLRCDNAGD